MPAVAHSSVCCVCGAGNRRNYAPKQVCLTSAQVSVRAAPNLELMT